MADFNSGLPIRTENAGDVVVRLSDATITSQQLAVNADGSLNITDNGASLTVDGAVTVSATDLDIRDLSHLQDSIKVGDGVDLLGVNSDGSINVNFATGSEVQITDGTDNLAINSDGSINVVVSDNTPGTPINDYNTGTSLAANSTSQHDYTVTAGKTLHLNGIHASGSGKMKIEVQVETGVATNLFTTKYVAFNSTATPNMDLNLPNPIPVSAGVRVRVIRTNRDGQGQDVYSTIEGYEV